MHVSLNGQILQKTEARIPAFHSGLFYGTGCFETIRVESGRLLFFDEHYKRLRSGLLYLGVKDSDIPSYPKLINVTEELLHKNGLMERVAKVRIQCTLAENNGYRRDDSAELFTLISAEQYLQKAGAKKLTIAETKVVPASCRPVHFKMCNMLHYRNAYRESQKINADDAVMLTVNGLISETSMANLFWKRGDTFYTPSKYCDLLPGITRKYVIEAIEKNIGFSLIEGEFSIEDLMSAESVWVTNSLMEIQQVECIDEQKFGDNKSLTTSLRKAYQTFKTAG